MALLSFRTSTYARNIYIYGTTTFQTIDPAYIDAVKQYAGINFTDQQIENAYINGYITEQEKNETLAY